MNRILGMIQNVRNWPAYLLHKWGLARQNPLVFTSLNDVIVDVPDRMLHTAKEVFFTDDYRFDKIKDEVLTLSNSPVIVDVGANVGYLSAFAFTRFPNAKVISVEPMPKNLELLRRNRERNSSFDWTVFEGVLAGEDGQLNIQFDNSDDYSTSASMYGLDSGEDSLAVKSLKFNSLLAQHEVSCVHILKLDCEGAEYDILYSLNTEDLGRIAFVTMETHQIDTGSMNRDAVLRWFQENGWKTQFIRSKVLAQNPNFNV